MKSETKVNPPAWIWYPGDYEIWLGNAMQNRRTERGAFFPPFWKMDSHYVLVEFSTTLNLAKGEDVELFAEGQYNVKLDGTLLGGNHRGKLHIPAGRHRLNIKVHNQAQVPAIFVRGETFGSDRSWLVTFEDKEWIDASGKASDTSSGTVYMNAGSWDFCVPEVLPSQFRLATRAQAAEKSVQKPGGVLIDFGRETFGYLVFHKLRGRGVLHICYGESEEEALDTARCETSDRLDIAHNEAADYTTPGSKAFRYVYIEAGPLRYDAVSMLYEYLPLEYKGRFRCNDDQLNRIWDVSAYTLHLTTREFFVDGIKRDRWVWSGDAYQSYLMNYYLFFHSPSVERTLLCLRGKDPVTSHINTIMDYTFYWLISIDDYYRYTGNAAFIEQIYPRMQSLMDYCLSRRNADGMLEGLAGDWVFIDWADFDMSKCGELSFEQLLFYRSLETMALCAGISGRPDDKALYSHLAEELLAKIFDVFWDNDKGAFVHNRERNEPNGRSEPITPFTNLFAVIFRCLDEAQTQAVKQNVLLNPNALKITTPYMRFYELEALCMLGEHRHVLQEIRNYWGGMLQLGATSFWEKYNPGETGAEHLAMYGRPYGKSLCHAWGASPLYLFGKYYLGVQPEEAGYKTFTIRPVLAGLQWMEGIVPTPKGEIKVYMDRTQIRVSVSESGSEGYLYFSASSMPDANTGVVASIAPNEYRIKIEPHREYTIKGTFQ
jgi:hypothetical protein